jgi:hypothetical protein
VVILRQKKELKAEKTADIDWTSGDDETISLLMEQDAIKTLSKI